MGHHLTSVIIHGMNAFLVVMIVICLISFVRREYVSEGRDNEHAPLIAAFITGLLFGIHPLHVESVAWVSERKDVLCAFFFLLSIFSYLRYAFPRSNEASAGGGAGRKYYVYSLILFMMALMSKPMAVTLPVILIILDMYPLERLDLKKAFSSHRKVLIEKVPFVALSIASSVLTVIAQHEVKAMMSMSRYSFADRFWIAIKALGFYLVKMVYPVNLAPLYPHPSNISVFTLEYFGSFMLVLGITAFSVFRWKKVKLWFMLWAYFLVTLLPVIGIIQVGEQAAADRYTYLPGLGPMLLAGLGGLWLWRRFASDRIKISIVAGFVIMILTLLSIMTTGQIQVWKDSISLWNRELSLYSSAIAYNNRGEAYSISGEYVKAIGDFNKAIELNHELPKVYYNRGSVYKKIGEHQNAILDFSKAIQLDPEDAQAYNNRGNVYIILEKYQDAMADFDKAVAIDPGYALAYNNRGNIYMIFGLFQKAIADFDRTIELSPSYAAAYYNRGNAYLNSRIYQKAISDYTKAVELAPGYAEAYNNRGNIYLRQGKYQEAVDDCTKAIELDPSYAFAYYNRALSYREMGDVAKANTDFRQAARLGDQRSQAYLGSIGIDY